LDDRRRDGGTNSTLRIKEQGTQLTLSEHDDDDDDDDDDEDDVSDTKHKCYQLNWSLKFPNFRSQIN